MTDPKVNRNQVRVQQEPFDPEAETAALRAGRADVGALVSFVGQMRDLNAQGRVRAMYLEHYPGMTESVLQGIVREAESRWALLGSRVVHRVGRLQPADPIVLVAVLSAHRGEAFQACEFIIDALKTRAPFWKKEHSAQGAAWVEARETDVEALARWARHD